MEDIRTIKPEELSEQLLEIPGTPKGLYIQGTLPNPTHKILVVVGSRHYSQYGKAVAEKLIAGLAGYNIVIVSGFAIGIDAIAHNAAIDAGLQTIAVLGSGLDSSVRHPKTNARLATRILESGGALVSELPPFTKAAHYTFPRRNRIVAGMSHAVLVVESTQKSGTLITARLATDYNRDVLAVPGPITHPNSAGPHFLIKDGATPITSSDDILEALHIEKTPSTQQSFDLSDVEQTLINTLIEPIEKEVLSQKTNLPIHTLNVTLSTLELKGIIRQRLGKIERV